MKINRFARITVVVAGIAAMASSVVPAQAAIDDNLICDEVEPGDEDSINCWTPVELALTCGYPEGDEPYIETGIPACDDNVPSGAPRGGKAKITAKKKAMIVSRLKQLGRPQATVRSKLPPAGLLGRNPASPSASGPASTGTPTGLGTAGRVR